MFIFNQALPISSITDGTSNTIMFSERANGKFPMPDQNCYCWWGDAFSTDTIFTTLYPMNPFNKVPYVSEEYSSSYDSAASSFHPGGANFAFADGSVHFLKDSISSWPFNPATGFPVGAADTNGYLVLTAGTQYGVYQALSTRNGGEVISSDAYSRATGAQGPDCIAPRTRPRSLSVSGRVSKFTDPTGLQVLKKCRVSGRRHFRHPTSFQGRGCENGLSTEDPAGGS